MGKIEEAKQILSELGLPKAQQGKIPALTLLALSGIREEDNWNQSYSHSLTLSKGVMRFVKEVYDEDYKPNTRESFRKTALKPFVEYGIVDLNPDLPGLPEKSMKTHYALTSLAARTFRMFGTPDWGKAVSYFKLYQFSDENKDKSLLRKISIRNYKSIFNETIELGRINVLIGANGSGKSNILESLAMVGASKGKDLDLEGLMSRGVRIAKPKLTLSSFLNHQLPNAIEVDLNFQDGELSQKISSTFESTNINDIYAKWIDLKEDSKIPDLVRDYLNQVATRNIPFDKNVLDELNRRLESRETKERNKFEQVLSEFLIYNLSTSALRGLDIRSRKAPLGINGEGIDILLSNLSQREFEKLNKSKLFFSWLDSIELDKSDRYKTEGYKLGKSSSTLYFNDVFMEKGNNMFSAENANEGILHVLFYLTLFVSDKTPKLFAIDNIETALNPKLCRTLMKELYELAVENEKQVLITTHNPAILDGINLNDDEQRLFTVYRSDEGMTKVRRITFKKPDQQKPFKLSEMWMKGLLGAVPQNF